MQNAEQQQDLKSRQEELSSAADNLAHAEQEMAALKSEHAQQLAQATKAVEEADAGRSGNEAIHSQLENLRNEHQQASTLYLPPAILCKSAEAWSASLILYKKVSCEEYDTMRCCL